MVAREELSHGTPIIVRNFGLPEIVRRSEADMIYNSDDQLSTAMDALLEDPTHHNEMGQRGRAAVQQHWSVNVHLKQYFRLIERIRVSRSPVLDSN